MIDAKEIEIDGKTFIISKFDAISGREIISQYPLTAIPKVGQYTANEALMLKVMHFVAVDVNGVKIKLTNKGN